MTYKEYIKYPYGQVNQIDGSEVIHEKPFAVIPWCKNGHEYKPGRYSTPLGMFEDECAVCHKVSDPIYKDVTTGKFYRYIGFGTALNGNYSTNIYESYT
jgi:hypothetical protein